MHDKDIISKRKRSWSERATNIAVGVADIVSLGEGKVIISFCYLASSSADFAGEEGFLDKNLAKIISTGISLKSGRMQLETVLEDSVSVVLSKKAAARLKDLQVLTGVAFEVALGKLKDEKIITVEEHNTLLNAVKLGVNMI